MCAWTRFLVLGGLVGLSIATLTGNDTYGWLAGLTAALALFAAERAFPSVFGATSCALPGATDAPTTSEPAATDDAATVPDPSELRR
jgi:hypothetical protein